MCCSPSFADDALEVLRAKKNLRLLATGEWLPPDYSALDFKRVSGGLVVQSRDASAGIEVANAKIAGENAPNRRRASRTRFRLARLQTREVKRNRLGQRQSHRWRWCRPNVAKGRQRTKSL